MNDIKHEIYTGVISSVLVLVVAIIAIIIPGILVLDYIHVLFGALWTGNDVFLGAIFFIVLNRMDSTIKTDVARRLIPMILFFIPIISVLTPATGIVLALRENIFKFNSFFIAILTIAGFLLILSYAIIVPYSIKIYKEFKNKEPDKNAVAKNLMLISGIAAVQFVFQVIIISLMAVIVVYG